MAHDDGGSGPHVPVLVGEVVEHLRPAPGGVFLDASVGSAGHSCELLARIRPGGILVGVDRDRDILPFARRRLDRVGGEFHLAWALFSEIPSVLDRWGLSGRLDGALFDLGISSYQLDTSSRGFSFDRDGPLDMRMGRGEVEPASRFLARVSEDELEGILREYGEEPYARRIAAAVVRERKRRPILRTRHLATIIEGAVPRRPARIHPATRCFQAVRSYLNREGPELELGIAAALDELRVGGRIAVISFHSLEDRWVKRAFKAGGKSGSLRDLTSGAVRPSADEVRRNRRARFAKLRVAEKRG